jgi:type VI secretion system secreted protein VgrG
MPTETKQQKTRGHKSSFKGEYPYVKVVRTASGHEIHFDDTPNNERIFIQHSSGTMIEMTADGKMHIATVGDQCSYGKGGMTCTVDHNGDTKITGHGRSQSGGGAHIVVTGDAGITVGGDTAVVGMGKVNMRAKSAYFGTDGDCNMNVGGSCSMKVAGDMTMETKGTHTIKAAKIGLN